VCSFVIFFHAQFKNYAKGKILFYLKVWNHEMRDNPAIVKKLQTTLEWVIDHDVIN